MISLLHGDGRRNAREVSTSILPTPTEGLTAGGRSIYRRVRRPAPTCNAIAELAGIGWREVR